MQKVDQMDLSPQTARILVCGTAKNVEKKLDNFFHVMSSSFVNFKEVRYLVCESFSTDKTREKLKSLQQSGFSLEILDPPQSSKSHDLRTARIAAAREAIRKRVSDAYSEFDLVVMADMDGVNRSLNSSIVDTIWDFSGWDAVFANQSFKYYDIWALRAKGWNESDCWEEFFELRETLGDRKARRIAIKKKMKRISPGSRPIKVDSAFGGLGIYKMDHFLAGTYQGLTEKGQEICEHVTFHQSMQSNQAELFILPSLINLNYKAQLSNEVKNFLRACSARITKMFA